MGGGESPVVGKCVSAKIDKAGLHIVIEFAETKLAEDYWQLYKGKFQRAFSVGFIPHASERQRIDSNEVLVFTEVELLEISCVPVPANRESLSRSAKRKRDFVAGKRGRGDQRQVEREALEIIDESIKQMELWERTPESKRSEVFTAEEIEYYCEMDKEAQAFADEIMGADAVDEEKDAGSLVDLVAGRR